MTDHLTDAALQAVELEREAQDEKWGEQNHPDGTGTPSSRAMADATREECEAAFRDGRGTWRHILNEEVREAFAEDDPEKLQTELVQVAAVALAWHESIARRTRVPEAVHFGRSFEDMGHPVEDECPCPKTACGLVEYGNLDPSCTQHPFGRAKTIRQSHAASDCPALHPRMLEAEDFSTRAGPGITTLPMTEGEDGEHWGFGHIDPAEFAAAATAIAAHLYEPLDEPFTADDVQHRWARTTLSPEDGDGEWRVEWLQSGDEPRAFPMTCIIP